MPGLYTSSGAKSHPSLGITTEERAEELIDEIRQLRFVIEDGNADNKEALDDLVDELVGARIIEQLSRPA